LIHHADLNIAATEAIAVSIQRHGAHAIVLPTLPDSANVSSTIRDATRTGIRLAFVGNPAHAVDLGMILPALEAILDENENAMFYWWGCRPGELAYHPQVRQGGPRVESYANHLHRLRGMHIDIALVPMLPTEVNRARSPIKYYDWTALGVPGIYSNILPFESVISPNQNGLLVDDRAESWYNAMKNLCNSPERRTQLGAGAQTHVRFLAAARNQDNLFQQLLQGNYPRKREQSHMSSTAGAYHVA
jgi:glycosyltransferase involved in cell wall biosynthesis